MTTPLSILVDLRAAQFNGDRGIPAFSQSLALELCRGYPEHRWLLLHDTRWPSPGRAVELASWGTWCTAAELEADRDGRIDAVLTGCFFLPHHTCNAEFLLPRWLRLRQPRRLGIVYDLIPWLFPRRYLSAERARRQYGEGLRLMREYDRLYAISPCTRRDTIRHAGVDPGRVHCIDGDIDQLKQDLIRLPAAATAAVPARYGLRGPYCACIGGDDWRKNLEATIRAFAIFRHGHPDHQLAIICRLGAERRREFSALAASLGLPADSIVCTGRVSDEDLVGLMRQATMLVSASLYEGLGLPVLEAHACGVPVAGSNVSSVADLVLPELTFDPRDPAAIAAAMNRLVAEPDVSARSVAFGRRLLEGLGWSRAAGVVMSHLAPQQHKRPRPPAVTRRCVAVVGALPPARTGIAARTLTHLQSPLWRSDFFDCNPGPTTLTPSGLLPGNRVLPVEVLRTVLDRGGHGTVVFVLGNSDHHVKAVEALIRTRGASATRRLAYLHEANLTVLLRAWLGSDWERLPAAAPPDAPPGWMRRTLAGTPAMATALRYLAEHGELDGVIVNSFACRDLVRTALGPLADRWSIDVALLPIEAAPPGAAAAAPEGSVVRVASFGLGAGGKGLDCVVQGVACLKRTRPARLTIAGWDVARHCRRTGIGRRDGVDVVDSPDDGTLLELMRGTDVAVQLRSVTHGESSGVVAQLLALGKQLVVNAEGSFAELPPELVTFVPVECTPDELARAIQTAATRRVDGATLNSILERLSPAAFTDRISDILGIDPYPADRRDAAVLRSRVALTLRCRDCDAIPKVTDAGRVISRDGTLAQVMHDGTLVPAGGYCGGWMTRVIAGLRGHHEPQEELLFLHLLRHVRPGTLIVELGSYWAYYSAWYLGAVPGSRAVCLEPEAAHMEVGRHTMTLNGRTARFIHARVGGPPEHESVTDAAADLDMAALAMRLDREPIEVLHMDVQGAETGFIRSMREAGAGGLVRFLVASTHHASITGSTTTHEDCLAELRSQGAAILADHSVSQSYSGDGLIVAAFDPRDANIALPPISCAASAESDVLWLPPTIPDPDPYALSIRAA
jgi:glycosyltransferase involved in cell wall biosynthesis